MPNEERALLPQSLALVSLLRIVSLSFTIVPTVTPYWLVIVYGVTYLGLIAVIAPQKMGRADVGLTGGVRLTYLLPFGVIIGTGLSLGECRVLGNVPLIASPSLEALIELSIV